MRAFYNEIDRYCCDWLQNLMDAGHIAPGRIDDRSICELRPDDVRGYDRVHFFAGIAGWDLALEFAGWPAGRPVWTGSCPCQPFSAAGQGKASDDERHLWPDWFRLIRAVRPPIVFGEQVEAAIGWGWLDLVFSDLGTEGYSVRSPVLPACGVGAPHIRQRLWFVADADGRDTGAEGLQRGGQHGQQPQDGRSCKLADADTGGWFEQRCGGLFNGKRQTQRRDADGCGGMGDPGGARLPQRERDGRLQRETLGPSPRQAAVGGSHIGELADAGHKPARRPAGCGEAAGGRPFGDIAGRGAWRDLEWLPCTDGKARPVEPGTFPLAHGIPGRVGRLRAYGNAIVPALAARFIKAAMEVP